MINPDDVLNFNFGKHPCPRISKGRISEDEKHPCFFCGYKIPVVTAPCRRCGLMSCPQCDKCYCSLSFDEKLFLYFFKLRCCNRIPESEGLEDLIGYVFIPKFAKFTQQAYEFCRQVELKNEE